MSRLPRVALASAAVILLVVVAFLAGRHMAPTPGNRADQAAQATASPASSGGRRILYWQDPMRPDAHFDQPGKSPFMDMPLQPVYADEGGGGVRISPQVQQNLGIRTAVVTRADVDASLEAVGTVQFDERLDVAVQTRAAGYLEHLAVRAPMERVARGQALATVFVPDWLGPLNDLVALKRAGASADLLAAARERTRALSIPADLVRRAEEGGVAQARYVIVAPASGVVAELGAREGVAVSPGMTLFRIAGLGRVWAVAEVPEAQAVHLARGQAVKAVLQADPGRTFTGTLQEILPQVNPQTRTLQARFEVDNRDGRLVPGMLLRLQVAGPVASRLVVPSEAVLRTGTRAVVIVRRGDGGFEPREVALGADLGDRIEVASGLSEGERVVASGQFLVDSEARLRSVLGSLSAAPAASGATPGATPGAASAPVAEASAAGTRYAAQGRVESVDAEGVTISHEAIPALKWPAMTMTFGKPDPKAFPDVKAGDRVRFEFRRQGDDYVLTAVHRTGGAR